MKREELLMVYSLVLWNIALLKYSIPNLLLEEENSIPIALSYAFLEWWGRRPDSLSQNGFKPVPLEDGRG